MRDASETPATPMMPHMLRSVSHASRNGAEIYVSQPRDRLLDLSVSQRDADTSIYIADLARAGARHAQLAGQCLNRPDPILGTGDNGAGVGFAEHHLVRGERCAVRG